MDEKRMAVWIEEDLIVVAYYAVPFVSIVAILTPRLAINGIVKNLDGKEAERGARKGRKGGEGGEKEEGERMRDSRFILIKGEKVIVVM